MCEYGEELRIICKSYNMNVMVVVIDHLWLIVALKNAIINVNDCCYYRKWEIEM